MTMKQVFCSGLDNPLLVTAATTEYTALNSPSVNWNTSESNASNLLPAGDITSFWVYLTIDPGNDVTFTIRDDGSDTGASFTIGSGNQTGSWSGTIAIAANSKMGIKYTVGGVDITGTIRAVWGYTFEPAATTKAWYPVWNNNNTLANTVEYAHADSSANSNYQWNATLADRETLWGCAGTIGDLRVEMTGAPGSSESYTIEFMLNGSAVTTGSPGNPQVVISNTDTSGEDTTNSFAIAAGDFLALRMTPSTLAANKKARIYFSFVPDTADEHHMAGGGSNPLAAAGGEFHQIGLSGGTWNGTENLRRSILSDEKVFSSITVGVEVAVTSGSILSHLRDTGGDEIDVTLIATNRTATDTVDSNTIAAEQLMASEAAASSVVGGLDLRVAYCVKPVAVAGANPKGPLGMPLHGPFGGPV